jgi:hypothetical protein
MLHRVSSSALGRGRPRHTRKPIVEYISLIITLGLAKGSGVVGWRGTISNIKITRSEVLQQQDDFYAEAKRERLSARV